MYFYPLNLKLGLSFIPDSSTRLWLDLKSFLHQIVQTFFVLSTVVIAVVIVSIVVNHHPATRSSGNVLAVALLDSKHIYGATKKERRG